MDACNISHFSFTFTLVFYFCFIIPIKYHQHLICPWIWQLCCMQLHFSHLPVNSMLIVNVYFYPTECTWQPRAQCDCRCNCSAPTVFIITCLLCLSFRKIWKTLCYTNVSMSFVPISLFRCIFLSYFVLVTFLRLFYFISHCPCS